MAQAAVVRQPEPGTSHCEKSDRPPHPRGLTVLRRVHWVQWLCLDLTSGLTNACASLLDQDSDLHQVRDPAVSLSDAFANSRMAPLKSSVSKKKFRATTSLGAASSIGR